MNPFQNSYSSRLHEWKNLRSRISETTQENFLVEVDAWWQQAPLVNHYLHPQDQNSWPDPWTLLSDNIYCTLTRAVGICYTLIIATELDVQLAQAVDHCGDEHNLVMVDNAKYILNYYPGSVLSSNLSGFRITRQLCVDSLRKNIR